MTWAAREIHGSGSLRQGLPFVSSEILRRRYSTHLDLAGDLGVDFGANGYGELAGFDFLISNHHT